MKVFKFYSGKYYYAHSGKDEAEAKENLFEFTGGEILINKTEEIPESKWDEKIINVWDENDFDTVPLKESIRDQLYNNTPTMIFTNDFSMF